MVGDDPGPRPFVRVIAFDSRDTGRSSHSLWPYSVAQIARDAVAVLGAASEERVTCTACR
jgi:pimeloyl-ACP methyl ester carboxylesterase